jgi:uncharacterized repeat protein (TIGR01451 family)
MRHGSVISYTLLSSIVGNSGVIPTGTVITLTDAVPPELTLVSGSVMQSTSTLPWTINISGKTITATLMAPAGGIAAGTVLPAISFDALINAGIKAGTIIENEATISAPGFAPVLASSSIEVGEQHQQCKKDCHHEQNECKNDRDDRHHQCPHVANWECNHNNNDSKKHSGSSNGGNKIIIINGSSSNSKSHIGSSNSSSSNAKSHSGSSKSSNSGRHSGSADSKSHSGSGQSHHDILVVDR